MSRRRAYGREWTLAVAALAAAGTAACREQHRTPRASPDVDTASFAAAARAGTERYQDQQAAIADGFRRVGVDFPAMGEHWVSLRRVMSDSFVASQPSVLTYVRADGNPRLVGVAYTALLDPGERPPSYAPARAFWHEHNGSVDEESLPLAHQAHDAPHDSRAPTGGAPRLSVLHAWVWATNPDGLFATDNWSLPFVRLGVAPPVGASAGAAGAVALALGAEDYYALTVRAAASPSPAEDDAVARILRQFSRRAERELARARGAGTLDASTARDLAALWSAMWTEVARAVPGRAARIETLSRDPRLSRSPS